MALKETIAFVGIPNETCSAAYIVKLAQEHYSMLLVASPDNNMQGLAAAVINQVPHATVEVMECAKDSCWEADAIVVVGDTSRDEAFFNKIKAVSTQKIIVGVWPDYEAQETFPNKDLQRLLPHSKVVLVGHKKGAEEVYIDGEDAEAVSAITNIAKQLGLRTILKENINPESINRR